MPEKKKPTRGEAYDERARALMKAIDARRSERAADAPAVHMMQRVQDEYGREAQLRDTHGGPFEFFPSNPSPGYEFQRQETKSKEASRPWRTGRDPRSLWNAMLLDRGYNEGVSDISGTPGELLPPYREASARRLEAGEEYTQRRNPQNADTLAKRDMEDLVRRSQKATPPVTQEDIDAMRELLARPGETSGVRDYMEMLPPEARTEEFFRRGSAEWLRSHPPKKKGK